MKNKEIEAINKLNNILGNPRDDFGREINNNIQILVQGLQSLDQEVRQKTFEVLNREQLLAQKEQTIEQLRKNGVVDVKQEFINNLHALHPKVYPANFNEWTNDLPMKAYVDQNYIKGMEENNKIYKQQLTELREPKIRQEFINNLHALHPTVYPANFNEWTNDLPMKAYVDQNYIKGMEENNKIYKQQLTELRDKEVERLKAEEVRKEQLLIDKYKETKDLKALIAQKELETQKLLSRKELEKQESLIQKENELLAQKVLELTNKSLVKNQVIGDLQDDIGLKEKEAYKLQIELLTKQLEFKAKEVELKDKALEDARAINELQGKLSDLKALYAHDISFSKEFSAIQFRAENSIANNDFGDIADLSRYISRLVEAERDNSVSADFSNLLANISPITHGEEQPIYRSIYIEDRSCQPGESLVERQMESLNLSSVDRQNQVVQTGGSLIAGEQMSAPLNQGNIMNHGAQNQNLIGNFDIENQHITHSVLLSGSVEISILEDGSI